QGPDRLLRRGPADPRPGSHLARVQQPRPGPRGPARADAGGPGGRHGRLGRGRRALLPVGADPGVDGRDRMSTRRYRIVHHTTMRYDGDVTASHNELRMTPVNEPGQVTLEARIRVRPLTWSHVYEDIWGTQVMAMEAQTPHDVLEIEATSMVERSVVPDETEEAGWEDVRSERTQDRLSEFIAQTARTAPPEDVVEPAARGADEPTPRAAGLALAERVRQVLVYEPGITGWQSTAAEVWTHGHGVCQDFAHLTLGGLRSLGIPARYVSGYV